MPLQKVEKIWMDGKLVDWDDANVHILTHTLHYGSGVFEGIRCYATSQGGAVFRLTDHIMRLFDSAKIFMIDVPYTVEQIVEGVKETVRAGLRLADAASPMPPATAPPRSVRMSPKRLSVTMTS